MFIVIGKSGQLASELKVTKDKNKVVFIGHKDIDLHNSSNIYKTLNKYNPKAIINASAFTNVDGAESNKIAAYNLNYHAVDSLFKYCVNHKIRFLHVSTDFIFDGNNTTPYKISDKPNPLNIYGDSKLKGELSLIGSKYKNYSIIRTSWLYSVYGKNFVKTMLKLMNEKNILNIIDDQIGCPTNARGLAKFLWQIANQDNIQNIYHWSDLGQASWFEFATEIYKYGRELGLINQDVVINSISSSDYPTAAIRPKFSVLETSKESQIHWKENLLTMLKEL